MALDTMTTNSWSVDVRFPLRWPPLSNSPIGGAVYAKWGCGRCGALLLPSAAASCCQVGQCISTTEQVGTSSALLTLGSLSGDQYTQFSGSWEVLVQSTRFAVGAHVNARRRIWREIRITTWADARSTCTCKLVSSHGGCTLDDAGTHASGGRSSQQGSAAAYTQTPANAPCMTLSVTLVADLEKQNLTRFLVVDLKNKILWTNNPSFKVGGVLHAQLNRRHFCSEELWIRKHGWPRTVRIDFRWRSVQTIWREFELVGNLHILSICSRASLTLWWGWGWNWGGHFSSPEWVRQFGIHSLFR